MIAAQADTAAVATYARIASGVVVRNGSARYEIQVVEPNVVRIHVVPNGKATPRTLVLDPHLALHSSATQGNYTARSVQLTTPHMTVKVSLRPFALEIDDPHGAVFTQSGEAMPHALHVTLADAGPFFGIDNTSLPGSNLDPRQDIRKGIVRDGGTALAGLQGDGGAPLVYTKRYGMLIDSNGGSFDVDSGAIDFHGGSRPDVEYFAIVGPPLATMRAVADLSGHAPMMPKWSLGFINTQWGSTESEVRSIIAGYRNREIPIDAFILDFDWKAWGEDNYGEWRWNSTRGAGSVAPDKFPDGASGAFAADMLRDGVKLGGIFKPRILLTNANGTPTAAAKYAEAHHFFLRWQKPYREYFSHREARDIDFSIPAARAWYWEHTVPAYRAGIVAFWNDEADAAGDARDLFPNLQFLDMQRALYDGVRSADDRRVFSLNRNFYLGSQRYGYGEWSGDIETSFDSMREQAIRMLGTVGLGEPHWSMDTGGFDGHPSPENYARWMQFAALVPIMRVHGTLGEKRQPWVYGAQAQSVAKSAIDLRYRLLPYFYSYERAAYEDGAGIVRPLSWAFPDDGDAVYQTDEWMDGDALLAAPIFGEGQTHRDVYLPAGTWYDYFRGTRFPGGTTIDYNVDARTWADIPLFVREGSIVATQTVQQWVGQQPATNVRLDVYPSLKRIARFGYYDDDGTTYAYERGVYFKQEIEAREDSKGFHVTAAQPEGSYKPPVQTYTIVVHGVGTQNDRFGKMTTIVERAGVPFDVTL